MKLTLYVTQIGDLFKFVIYLATRTLDKWLYGYSVMLEYGSASIRINTASVEKIRDATLLEKFDVGVPGAD